MDLSWYLYPLFFFAGLLAGFINTLAGNGSVFTLSLLLFSGMPAGHANGTNRVGALVQCIVSIATFRNSSQFKPLLKNSAVLMVPAFIGAVIGANSAINIPDDTLTKVIGYLMIFMLGIVLLKPKRWLIETVSRENNKSVLNYLIFFAIGWYAGFIQMGMGVLFLAALVLVSKYRLIHANMIKIMISFAILFPALLIYIYNNQVDWEPAIAFASGQGLGAWVATKFALENKNASIWVRRILIVMILLAIIKLFNLYTNFI